MVAAGELDAGEVQLAGDTVGHRAQAGVEHAQAGVPHGAADGHGGGLVGAVEGVVGDVDRGLGGAVQVVQGYAGQLAPAVRGGGGQGLAAAEDAAQGGGPRGVGGDLVGLEERLQHRGHEVHRRDALLPHERRQMGGVPVAVGLGEHDRRAFEERPEELPHGDVEAGGRLLEHPVVGRQPVRALHPGEPVDDGAVGDDHALGQAGGAGGVDQVGGVVGVDGACGSGGRGPVGVLLVEQEHGGRRGRQPVRDAAECDHRARPGVGEHVGDAVGRVVRIDGQVRGAGLQHAEQGHHQFGGPGYGDRDEPAGSGAPGPQPARQRLGAGVEFDVGQAFAGEDDRCGVRRTGGPGGDGLGEGGRLDRALLAGRVGAQGLVRGEQVEGGRPLPGVVGELLQQARQPVPQQAYGLGVQPPGVVLEPQVEPFAGLDDECERIVHGVVEGVPGDADGARGVPQVGLGGIVLEHDQGVEEFALAGVSGQALDLGESEMLVVQQAGLLLLEAGQQGAQGLARGPAQPGGQGVDEQADHGGDALDLAVAAGDGGAEEYVVAAGEPAEEQAPGGLHDGAEGDAVLAGAVRQACGGAFGQFHPDVRGLDRFPGGRGVDQAGGPVQSGERGAPGLAGGVAVLSGEAAQEAAVGGDLGQGGGVGAVAGHEFAVQDGQGPAVGHRVVEGQDEPAAVSPEPDQGAAQQGRCGQVEAGRPLVGGDGVAECLAEPAVLGGQVDLPPGQFGVPGDDLHGGAVGAPAEGGAQGCVPVEEALGGAAQGGAVDRPGEVEDLLDDVDVAVAPAGQGVEEEALLEWGEREQFLDVEGVRPLDLGQFAGLDVHQRGLLGVFLDAFDGRLGEGLGGAVPEDVPGGQAQSRLAGADEELDGGDAVAAEGEEVVLSGDRVQAEHLGEEGAQQLLARGLGCASGAHRAVVGGGQGAGVDLAARGDGQRVQGHQRGRDHVVGQPVGGVRAQGPHQGVDVAEGRRAVGVRVGAAAAVQAGVRVGAGEDGVEGAVVGGAVPGERGAVAVAFGQGMQVLGVGGGGGRAAAPFEGAQVGEVVGEAGVGDAGDAQACGALGEQRVEVVRAGPGDLALVGCGRLPAGVQDDVVPVAGQLVVVGAPLDADLGVEAVQGGEVVGVQQEFALPAHRLLDRGAQGALVVGRGAPGLDGGAQGAQQAQIADVADEDPPAGCEQPGGGAQDLGEVVGAREVLGDGVDDDGVEVALGEPGGVVGGLGAQVDAGEVRPGAQGGDRLGGQVGAPVLVAVGGDPGEDQAAADADLQYAPGGAESADPAHGVPAPLAHLLDGDREPVVHAVPAREVLLGALRTGGAVEEFVDLLPLLDVAGRAVEGGDDVGGEAAVAGAVLAGDDGDLVDGGVAAQHGLDLAGFDAEAADLDLGVGAAEELQATVGLPAHEVAGAVEPFAGCAEGVGDEAFGGQARAAEVAAGQARAAEVQLAGDARRDGAQVGVEDVRPGARVGHADRHDGPGRDVGVAQAQGGVGGRLGGAVGVEHHPPARVAAHQFRGDTFGAGQQRGGRGQSDVVGHGGEQGGRQDHEGDAVRVGVVGERCAGDTALGGDDDEAAAGEQSEAQVPEGDVEARGGELEHAAVRADAEPFALGGHQLGHSAVGEDDALGASGGAGGVDDVGGVVDGDRRARVVCRVSGQFGGRVRRVELQDGHAVPCGQFAGGVRGGHHADGGGVAEHVGDAVHGVVVVDRQVGGARLEDGGLGDDEVRGARQGERDDPFGSRAAGEEGVGEAVGAFVQFGVGEFLVLEDERDGVGAAAHLCGEHRGPGVRGDRVVGGVPVEDDTPVLLGPHQLQAVDGGFRVVEGCRQQGAVVDEQAVDGRLVEQARVVGRARLAVAHLQQEVDGAREFSGGAGGRGERGVEEQSAAAGRPGAQGVGQQADGDPVGFGLLPCLGDAPRQFPEVGGVFGGHPHREAVVADGEVGCAAVAVQQGEEGREQVVLRGVRHGGQGAGLPVGGRFRRVGPVGGERDLQRAWCHQPLPVGQDFFGTAHGCAPSPTGRFPDWAGDRRHSKVRVT